MCAFCDMQSAGVPPAFENERFFARLDIHPVSPGHLLLIPKRHVERQSDLLRVEERALCDIRKQAEAYVENLQHGERGELYMIYRKMLEDKITPNSEWFAKQMLLHPRIGCKPDGINYIVNEGGAAGQTVDHLHAHVIPRYNGDMRDPSGGGRYVIPKMGNYRRPRVLLPTKPVVWPQITPEQPKVQEFAKAS